jgi:hypothetical protein
MFHTILIAILLTLSVSAVRASQAEEERIARGKEQFSKFLADGRELETDQYFLVSLATAIRPEDFDNLRKQYGMLPLSVHFCTADGVLTVGLTPAESAVTRVGKTNLLSVMGGEKRYISPVELGGDLTPNDPKLCGFEARMTMDFVKKFHEELNTNVLSIEIKDMRRRFFAVNHNLREKP